MNALLRTQGFGAVCMTLTLTVLVGLLIWAAMFTFRKIPYEDEWNCASD